jgi:hypothetical protein
MTGGSVPYGKCSVCGKEDVLFISRFYYDIDCECCGGSALKNKYHFERIQHCKNCTPIPPTEIRPVLKRHPIPEREYWDMKVRLDRKGVE